MGIHLLTGDNPIQVLVTAIANGGCREDSTRIGSGGVVRRQAVDVSPLRRVNQGIYLICKGARESAFRTHKSIANALLMKSSTRPRDQDQTPSQCVKRTKSRESPRVTDERSVAASSKDRAACASM